MVTRQVAATEAFDEGKRSDTQSSAGERLTVNDWTWLTSLLFGDGRNSVLDPFMVEQLHCRGALC